MIKEGLPGGINPEKLDIKKAPLKLTEHALVRFKERWKPLDRFDVVPKNDQLWKEKIETLIQDSREISLGSSTTVKRLINSHFKDARYFLNKRYNLRFVVIEVGDSLQVVTVENSLEKNLKYIE